MTTSEQGEDAAGGERRVALCHYHIFKNSGTSFDELLAENFPGEPVAFDGPYPFSVFVQDELLKVIRNHPKATAFTSHQVRLPVPAALDIEVLPVVFLRHPLLRVRSVYEYLRRRERGSGLRRLFRFAVRSTYTSRDEERASELSFPDWVREALDGQRPIGNLSNAQTQLLGGVYGRRSLMRVRPAAAGGVEADLAQALRNLAAVELLARTEYYQQDVASFSDRLAARGIAFSYRERRPANTTARDLDKPLSERLERMSESLGDELYERLAAVNRDDLALYRRVCERLDGAVPDAVA
ncbi:hypothetical protein [Pseudohaliea rubra]|nr:hypothetical protein [Pseudohaliea rubra]